jgi:hypothetical protein
MTVTEFSFPVETEELDVIIPEFIELIEARGQLAIANGDLGLFSQLELIVEDGAKQLQAYRAKLNTARQALRLAAYGNYKIKQVSLEEPEEAKNDPELPPLTSTETVIC